MVFGAKAVTYAIKHGLGVGHSLKSRSYQVRVKKYPPLDVIFHSKWQIWDSCSEAGSCHIHHPRQGRYRISPRGGRPLYKKVKELKKETLSQSSTCRYALCHAYHPVCIPLQVLTRSCAGSVEATESDKLREHSGIWKGTRKKNVTDVLCFEANWENMALCEPM